MPLFMLVPFGWERLRIKYHLSWQYCAQATHLDIQVASWITWAIQMAHLVTSISRASAIAEWWLDDAGVQLCSLYAKPTWPHLLQSWCHVRGRGNGECWLMLCCDQCVQRDRQSMMGYIADAMHGAWSRYDLVVVVQPELSTTFWGFGWLLYSCHWLCCGKHWAQLCSCNAARTFILLQPLLSANLIILYYTAPYLTCFCLHQHCLLCWQLWYLDAERPWVSHFPSICTEGLESS